jgi:hypothetical protein
MKKTPDLNAWRDHASDYERGFIDGMQKQAQSSVDRAINASLDRTADAMDEVAHRFAHRLALDLECVLAKYDGPWYDQAWETLSQYRSEMNKLHEQVSPTFMGEPVAQKWFCLSCKSSTPGHHGTLNDRTTPCPEGLRAKNKENK